MIRAANVIALTFALACGRNEEPPPEAHAENEVFPESVALDSAELAGLDLDVVAVGPLPPDTLRLTGSVTFDASRVSHVGPRLQGRIREVMVEAGSPVAAGDTLAVLDSPELGAAQTSWFKAAVTRDVARRDHERVERLSGDGIVSERRRIEAESELRKQEAELAAAERTLAALGAEPDSSASSLFVLRSPLSGVVVDKHATAGEVVGSDSELFTVGDVSRVWLILDLYETDLARVPADARATVTVESYPDRRFAGRVTYVAAVVDTVSRTVKVRLDIANGDRALKPGMFAHAALVLPDAIEVIGVPAEAMQRIEDRDVVFIDEGGGRFAIRQVVPGRRRAGGFVEIRGGLDIGDSVVTVGSFALKAQLMKASFGEAH